MHLAGERAWPSDTFYLSWKFGAYLASIRLHIANLQLPALERQGSPGR